MLTHHDGFSELYWGRTITVHDLDNNKAELIREIKDAILMAWDNLPLLHQKILTSKEQKKRLIEQLRAEGKLI